MVEISVALHLIAGCVVNSWFLPENFLVSAFTSFCCCSYVPYCPFSLTSVVMFTWRWRSNWAKGCLADEARIHFMGQPLCPLVIDKIHQFCAHWTRNVVWVIIFFFKIHYPHTHRGSFHQHYSQGSLIPDCYCVEETCLTTWAASGYVELDSLMLWLGEISS